MDRLSEIKEKLEKYDKSYLLQKYDELDAEKKEELLDQIEKIDFDEMESLYKQAITPVDLEDIKIEPVQYTDRKKITSGEKENMFKNGLESIEDGKLAVVTMAGGQGTRLGHDGPKGTYILLEEEGKSLFELLCENLKEASKDYNQFIHWYIMTSYENYKETVDFFEKNNYFDYPKNYIKFFKQSKLPMLGENGDILMTEEGLVKEASDGHGGTLTTLKKTGILDEMNKKGFDWVFVSGVDNVLANLADPLLIGFAESENAEIAVKSVEKTDPKEKVGVFCRKDGNVGVIEYTEITDEMATMRDKYGSLVYGDSNALLHLFSLDALNKICEEKLPYHTAHKKADYLDRDGNIVKGETPNAYKFESFIFDAFEMLDNVSVLRVKREEEFAPLKNKEGVDSPETALKLYKDNEVRKHAYKVYNEWLKDDFGKEVKDELISISGNDLEIKDRFYKDLDFGTAGLRGIMGAGTNRMNEYTVLKATQGLANYLISKDLDEKPVIIAYDTRNNSKKFAELTSKCFNANGIRTFEFNKPWPVPVLAFATRIMKASVGIMITASHNPAEYNGYKVFWSDGAQINEPVDKEIITEVNKIKKLSEIKTMDLDKAKEKGLYNPLGDAIIDRYLLNLKELSIKSDVLGDKKDDIRVVYTPVNGTGNIPLRRVLKDLGYKNVFVVPEQEAPNGYFTTLDGHPNPEDPKTFEYSIELAKEVDADICVATDPDADRLGIMVKDSNGEYVNVRGNEIAEMLLEYIIETRKEEGTMPENPAIISTIVSTNLARKIADENDMAYFETLTGFKHIGKIINDFEENDSHTFLFGFEESFGYLYGTNSRDKDGVVATMMLVEAAAYYKSKGMTLLDHLDKIYDKYGHYKESQKTLVLKGMSGANKIQKIMDDVRNREIKEIEGIKVLKVRDYLNSVSKDLETGEKEYLKLPKSNVMYFELEDDAWLAVRPSGTEPKLKFYIGTKGKDEKEAKELNDRIANFVDSLSAGDETKSSSLSFKGTKTHKS